MRTLHLKCLILIKAEISDLLDPIHTEQERCRLENGYGIHLQATSLAAAPLASLA